MVARSNVLRINALALGLAALGGVAHGQSSHAAASGAPAAEADMAMPDDLGAPLAGAKPETPAAGAGRTLSVSTPIALIAANPRGRAVLEQDMPGLCERPEFVMFKGMSPAKLAVLSGGRISNADLVRLQSDLTKVDMGGAGPPRAQHSVFTRSARSVGRFSKAVYHHMAVMIASL